MDGSTIALVVVGIGSGVPGCICFLDAPTEAVLRPIIGCHRYLFLSFALTQHQNPEYCKGQDQATQYVINWLLDSYRVDQLQCEDFCPLYTHVLSVIHYFSFSF